MIHWSSAVQAAIRAHAERDYPDECCGVLLGDVAVDVFSAHFAAEPAAERHVVEAVEMRNVHAGEHRRRFQIAPQDYRHSEDMARARHLKLIGFYHSHPDHAAEPSAYDLEHALPWHSYVIVSVANGHAERMTSWILATDRSRFVPEALSAAESRARTFRGERR